MNKFKDVLIICRTMNIALAACLFFGGAAIADSGKILFGEHCSSCHQTNGSGVPMMQPSLKNIERANVRGGVIEMILKGSDAVEDSQWQNEMGSFEYLTNTEIVEIANYVRTHFDNHSSPVTVSDVIAGRNK